MESKNLIVMIIVVSVFFCGQLTAEEVVGESIFPNIETPHPYPTAAADNTLVWFTTIQKPGAAWIKIHFSEFRLNPGDFVILTDMKGKVIELIRGRDVTRKRRSKFKVKKNDNKTVSFWGPAIDGDRVVVGLYSTSDNKKDWGFTIDEVGVGCKPIFDIGLGPLYNKYGEVPEKTTHDIIDNLTDITHSRPKFTKVFGSTSGIILYRKGFTWFTGNGFLTDGNYNEFVLEEQCIDDPEIVDSLEVRFYMDYMVNGDVSTVHYNYYCENFFNDYFSDFGTLILKHNRVTFTIYDSKTSSKYIFNMGRNPNMELFHTLFKSKECKFTDCKGVEVTMKVTCEGEDPGTEVCVTHPCEYGDEVIITCCCIDC